MLIALDIQDIVLIDRLRLDLGPGLTVLTGETGAGKSILLDSLSLALGARGDAALLRQGADQGSVTAVFALPRQHPAQAVLDDAGLGGGEELILRRVLSPDGRGRAFVNDQPVSVGLLRQLGDLLVEVHGQHDDRGLLNTAGHRDLLDEYAGTNALKAQLGAAHADWRQACGALEQAQADLQAVRAEEEYLRHAVAELTALDAQVGEEQTLAEARATMLRGQSVHEGVAALAAELSADGGVDATLRGAVRRLERLAERAGEELAPALAALDRAAIEAGDAVATLEETLHRLDFDPATLDRTEARLFEIRAMARKYRCDADKLSDHAAALAGQLAMIDQGDADLNRLGAARDQARARFEAVAADLSAKRQKAAARLDKAVAAELAPLKLEKARFRTILRPLAPNDWTAAGAEQVAFEVSTNPGAPFGPLLKIASGGELARFILALKVALLSTGNAAAMIFDEVDRGIGGATASAVGARLARLADGAQVVVVTHSPQVAARAARHWRIEKRQQGKTALTQVSPLSDEARREEIARMLSGDEITDAARAAAQSLLADAG